MLVLTRREAVAGMVLLTAGAGRVQASSPLTLVEPYGPESSTGQAVGLLRPALSRIAGTAVEPAHLAGEAGGRALRHVAAAAPDGRTLLVTQLLSRYASFDTPADGPSYRAMTPAALLTGPISAALVVSHRSQISDWEGFERRVRSDRVRIAHNPIMLFAVPLGMLEAQFGRFDDVLASTRAEMIAALDEGRADAGLLPTISLLTADGKPPLRPIVTFGGGRNQWFDGVPTYREVGQGVRTAITGAIASFAPPALASGVQTRLTGWLEESGRDPDVIRTAAARRYPLNVTGPDALVQAMDRCARVIRDMKPYLRDTEGAR